jgi:KaiC/GvpD/RAD55 family RecA-like ATPase
MAMSKTEKLSKWFEKNATAAKDKRIDAKIIKVSDLKEIEFVKTGNALFDTMIGGFPRGRFSLIFGGPAVGKTTLLAQICGKVINDGLTAMIFEPENRAEKGWMTKFMDSEKVFMTQTTSLGTALDSLIKVVDSGCTGS